MLNSISLKNLSRRRLLDSLVVSLLLVLGGFSRLQAQNNAALTAFPTFNGGVWAIAVSGTTVYVGGSFTQATNSPINGGNTVARSNLAAIDANTGALLSFNPQVNNTVRALILNTGLSRLYVGGDFTMVNGSARNLVCSFDVGTNTLNAWNPVSSFTGSYVRNFALDGNNLYACGQFTNINGSSRKYGCFFDGTGAGALDAGFNPDIADNQTLGVAINGVRVHFGGDFSGINGNISYARFGAVNKTTGATDGWGTGVGVGAVHTILVDGTFVYSGGSFASPHPRNRVNRQDIATSMLDGWDPNIGNNNVWSIARNNPSNLTYVGGDFTIVNGGTTRNGLAGFDNAGAATAFNPNITGGAVVALAYDATTTQLYVGGAFTTVGGQPRQGFAAFSNAPAITLGAAPASAYPMQVVTITGTNLNQPIGQVLFNGVASPSVRLVNATSIEAVVPFGATTGPITVNTGTSSANTAGSFTPNTIPQVATFVGRGPILAPNNSAGQLTSLNQPLGITLNASGDMFIAESVGNIIRRITEGGRASVFAGSGVPGLTNALGTAAQFSAPVDVAFDNANNLYVSDYSNNSIRKIDPAGNVTTLAAVNKPGGIVFDGTDLVVCSQLPDHVIYKVTLGGAVTLFAGAVGMVGTTDGLGTAARFNNPMYIAKDASNNLYVTDSYNHRIRKITPAGNVTTLAGSTQGYADGLGTAAQFRFPSGIAVDAGGVIYVGDGFGGLASNHRVRMIQPNGLVSTLAGTGANGNTDGAYNVAQFPLTMGGAVVKGDTIFVSGRENHDVRRIHIAKYQYVSGDAGIAANWKLLDKNGVITAVGAPDFAGPAFQFIVASGTATAITGFTLGANCVMTVKNGATLQLNGNSTNSGAIIVENGGTLEVSNGVTLTNSGQLIIDNGLAGGRLLLTGTGSVASTTPIYGDAVVPNNATLESGGGVAKNLFVSEIPSPMPGRLVVSNTVGTTPPNVQSIGATGTVTVTPGARMIIPNGASLLNNNPSGTSFTVQSGAVLLIQGSGEIAVGSSSAVNYLVNSALEYAGATVKTTNAREFPAIMNGNVFITNTSPVTLDAAKTLGASATLTLTAGRIITSAVNMLTVTNTAAAAVTSTSGYVDGPLQRDMPAALAAPAQTYSFPVGVGATKYPFAITQPTTGGAGPRLQVQAFVGNAMGTAGTNISLLSTTEYWQLQQISGNYTSGRIYVEKAGLLATQAVGGNPAMANGTYNGNLSTLSTGLTTVSAVTGVGHFIVGTGPVNFVWNGAPGASWTVPTNWTPNRTTPAATDILQFNAGTHTPTNVPTENIQQLVIGGNVTLAAGAAQTLTVGSGGVQITGGNSLDLGNNVVLTQAAGATMQVDGTLNTSQSYVNGAGNFVLSAAGTLATSRGDGINGTAINQGAVQVTGPITYSLGASYTFNSSASAINTRFSAAGGKSAVTANPIGTLTTSGMNDITLDANATVSTATNINGTGAFQTGAFALNQAASATLTIAGSARLRLQTGGGVVNNNASGTSFTVQNMGTLEIQNTGSVTGSSDVNYVAGSTLEYSGTAAKTTMAREIGTAGVQNLLISNTMPVTLGANALVVQSLNINAASKLILSNVGNPVLTLNGSINQNGGANIASVNGANAGSITLGGAGGIALRLDAIDNTLNNFTVNRNGAHTITGDLNVLGTLDLTSGILIPSTRILIGDPIGTAVGVINGGNTSSYVQGKLQRRFAANIATAGTNYTFPIGTSGTGYRPATLVNTLTGVMSPVVEMENYDMGATTIDISSVTSLLTPRNWRVQTMSGNFNGSEITLLDAGLTPANAVARSVMQAGMYQGFGGNSIGTTITSNAGAVPASVNHFFAIASVQPSITGVMPTTVSPGDTLFITGNLLNGVLAVAIGGVAPASYTIVSPTLIRAIVGQGATGPVSVVYVGGSATSMSNITFNNAPIITGFSPSFGTTGSTIRLTGTRLSNPSNVSFGGMNALSLQVVDSSNVNAVVGNGSSGIVSIQTPNGIATSSSSFDFIVKPSIVNFFPKWAKAGDTVNIFGGNFQRVSSVRFGNSTPKMAFTLVTNGQITILMPSDASTGLIRLENPVGQDSLGIMTAVKTPTISSAQPFPFIPIGQQITIRGTEFHPFPIVQIGTVSAATVEWTSLTEMKATFTQATSGILSVIASGGTVSMLVPMQVVPPPTITSFSPSSPLPGEVVTVTGATFLANLLTVTVNGLPVQNLMRHSDNKLSFTMPQATAGPLVVNSLGGTTSATITFQPITVTAVQPASGMIGTQILLTGTRFTGATAIGFGTVTTSQFTVVSPTQIRVIVPTGVTVGTISVIGPAGVGTLVNAFTITVPSPIITSFTPQMQLPGQIVTINGQNFTGTRSVSFGGVTTAQFTVVSPNQIRATVPPFASSGSITVMNGAGMGMSMGFIVLEPPVNPNSALTSFPTFNGKVRAISVHGNTVYVGGDFTQATNAPINGGNTIMQSYLAAIDATTGALIPLNLQPNNIVRCLAVGNGRVYAGGDFTMVNATARKIVFSFDASNNTLNTWNPVTGAANGVVTSFSMSGTTLYCVGTFTQMNAITRKFSCAFDGTGTGSLLSFHGDVADNQAFAITVNGSSAYIGGSFSGINANISKKHFGSVDKVTGNDAGWGNNKIPICCVESLSGLGNNIYVGGSFTNPRNRLLAFEAGTGNLQSWNPDITDGSVLTMTESGSTVYVGGWFTKVNGNVTRTRLAGFSAPPATATVTSFSPNIADGAVLSVASSGNLLFAGGEFTTVDGQQRQGFAAFNPTATPSAGTAPPAPSTTAPNITSFAPQAATPMQSVMLTGVRFTGTTDVKIGGKTAWFKVNSDTEIQVVVPFGALSGDISVSNGTETGTLAGFTALEIPRVSTVAGNGMGGLTNSAGQLASLNYPRFGAKIGDNLYFSSNHAIRKVNLLTGEVGTVAGGLVGGNDNGIGEAASFDDSYALLPSNATDGQGTTHLLVADHGSGRIRRVNIETGEVTNSVGSGRFSNPCGLARDNRGPVVISDKGDHVIRVMFNQRLYDYAGFVGISGSTDGSSETEALLNGPSGLAIDSENYLYVADNLGNKIRKIWLEDGTVTTLSGTGEAGFADGAKDKAKFNSPMGLALNGTILFVADKNNQRIRAVDTRTGETVTVAGTGTSGFSDGSLQTAQFTNPHSLVWDDASGTLLVFDTDNHRIRRVDVGAISFAGTSITSGTSVVVKPASMRILNIAPLTVTEGSNVTLSGENISTLASISLVMETNTILPLEIISRSTTEVIVRIPNNIVPNIELSTSARFIVTTSTVRLSPIQQIDIKALEVPFVSIVTPNTGTTRSIVSVLGQNLAPLNANVRGSVRSVSIGGVPVRAFAVVSPNIIQVTVGTVRSGKVLVETLTGVLEASNTFTLDTSAVSAMMPPVTVVPIESVNSRDSIALNRLFAATQGMQWVTTSNWTNGAPVVLRSGIRVRDGRVVEIRLPSFGLVGSIPADVLQTLDKLEVLDLSNNRLSGVIPPMLANAQNLEVLNLQGNRFVGALPQGFCAMGKMRELNLAGNSLEDSVARLCCLTNATNINLEGNKFVGAMPPCVQNLSRLSVLNLARNGASGAIPDAIGQLRSLTQVNLRGNRFTGVFPRALGQSFTNPVAASQSKNAAQTNEALGLEILDLGENGFTGSIPDEIGNLVNLRIVRLDHNNFTGILPKGFLAMNRLRVLDVSNNQLTSGPDLNTIRLDTLLVNNNRFEVVALERFSGVRVYRYLPQDFAQPRIIARSGQTTYTTANFTIIVNEPLTLSLPRTENFSRTQWRKNGIPLRNLTDTSRNAVVAIPAFTLADTGVYDCVITNDLLAGIILTTAQIQVRGEEPKILPTAVELLTPRANEEDLSVEPRFRWTSSRAADGYRIQIATDSSFAAVVSSARISQTQEILIAGEVIASRATAPQLYATGFPLQNDRRYYWRVRTENRNGESVWSTSAFTTVPLNAELSIGTLDFGNVPRRQTARGVVRITNFGAATLTLVGIKSDNNAFVMDSLPVGTVLAPGRELLFRVSTPAEKLGNSVGNLTVSFRSGMNPAIQERTSANRLAVRVQGVKLTANPLDTVIVGKRVLTTVIVNNLTDEIITVRDVTMLNKIPDFERQPVERNLEILPNQLETIRIAITAQKEGEIPEEILQAVVVRGDISTTVSRERFDTVQISSRVFARRARPEDMFIRVRLKAAQDSVAPGGLVAMELLLEPQGAATFTKVLQAGTPSFNGTLRWNPNVLVLSQGERGLRRVRQDTSTVTRRTNSITQQFSLAPGLFWDGRSSLLLRFDCLSVAGNTDVTPLIIDNFQWGAGTVFIDSLIMGTFTAKACEAGGKRLVTTAKVGQIAAIAPNPVKEEVRISYTVREDSFVELALIDAHGKTAQVLVNEEQTAGDYTITKNISALASGSYTVRLRTSTGILVKRVNLVR